MPIFKKQNNVTLKILALKIKKKTNKDQARSETFKVLVICFLNFEVIITTHCKVLYVFEA